MEARRRGKRKETMRACRLILLVASLSTVFISGQGLAFASSTTVVIERRNGGQLLKHIHQAMVMIRSGYAYRVVGDQYSAAAMQVLYLESRVPVRLCAIRKARLHFHLGKSPRTGKSMKKLDWISTQFIRPQNARRLGKLPDYGEGFKSVKASKFLGLCRSKTLSCNVAWCGY
jgi:hypothetical protein